MAHYRQPAYVLALPVGLAAQQACKILVARLERHVVNISHAACVSLVAVLRTLYPVSEQHPQPLA